MPLERRRLLPVAAAVACALFIAYVTVGVVRQSTWACERKDRQHHVAMERRIEADLRGLPHRFQRHSQCEEAGRPLATLTVEVEGWESWRDVRSGFLAHGWVAASEGLRSADGRYQLRTYEELGATRERRVATASVRLVDQVD